MSASRPKPLNLQIMNYFELYGLPLSFRVDQAALKKRFYALSRQYHPDFFTRSAAAEQADVLEKAAMVVFL